MQEQPMQQSQPKQEPNYAELLEKEYGQFKVAQSLIHNLRNLGYTDKDIYEDLESFY